jgi:hypothetical protein
MLAVPAVPVEEDEMHLPPPVQRFLHPEKLLNRGAGSTETQWIQRPNLESPRCN